MRDVLHAKHTVRGSTHPDINWAISQINAFRYRERFHLSYKDFMQEPMEVYRVNMFIMQQEAKKQKSRMSSYEKGLKGKLKR